LGTDRFSFGFGGTGKKSHNKNFDDYGEPFGKSDVIGCCLDLDQFEVRFLKNGIDLGRAFSIPQQLRNEAFFPAVVLKNAEMQFNFGDEKFKHEPPKDFVPVNKALSDNTKSNPNYGAVAGIPKAIKVVSNAPYAIIIEVCLVFVSHSSLYHSHCY
jgi:ATP-dependent RNA helicase DDX1